MRKPGLFAVVLAVFAALFLTVAPSASAAQSPLTAYEHAGYVNPIQVNSIGSCLTNNIYYSLSLFGVGNKMSSIYFSEGASQGCNYLSVTRAARSWPQNITAETWGHCISSGNSGIEYFGPGYNDNINYATVKYDPRCPPWRW